MDWCREHRRRKDCCHSFEWNQAGKGTDSTPKNRGAGFHSRKAVFLDEQEWSCWVARTYCSFNLLLGFVLVQILNMASSIRHEGSGNGNDHSAGW